MQYYHTIHLCNTCEIKDDCYTELCVYIVCTKFRKNPTFKTQVTH